MKRTLSLLLIVSLLAGTAACGAEILPSPSPSPIQSETPTPQPTTPTPTPAPTRAPYDFSGHSDPREGLYTTMLVDTQKLADGVPLFATHEPAADVSQHTFQGFDEKIPGLGYHVSSVDISGEDLSVIEDIHDLSFNSDTIWPDRLPEGFDPDYLLEHNKNPGLGIRELHEQGITGEDVGIAIIDQALLLDHEQYADNLMSYERIHCGDGQAAFHGTAVASIAVGKDIGVAPGARLYYIASTFGHSGNYSNLQDTSMIVDCILRVLEINEVLPANEKIRVISISKGYTSIEESYNEIQAAIKLADAENIFVITASTKEYYPAFELYGLGRKYHSDPDDFGSYLPAAWIEDDFYAGMKNGFVKGKINFPMGSRTYASYTGAEDYALSYPGGVSWAVPWCAGLYALCCQVNPDLTPAEFIKAVNETAVDIKVEKDGKKNTLPNIVDPQAVIDAIRR